MATPLTFIVRDPNPPQAVAQALQRILLEKLLTAHSDSASSPEGPTGREP